MKQIIDAITKARWRKREGVKENGDSAREKAAGKKMRMIEMENNNKEYEMYINTEGISSKQTFRMEMLNEKTVVFLFDLKSVYGFCTHNNVWLCIAYGAL